MSNNIQSSMPDKTLNEISFWREVPQWVTLTKDKFIETYCNDWTQDKIDAVWQQLCNETNKDGHIKYDDNDADDWEDWEGVVEVFVEEAEEKIHTVQCFDCGKKLNILVGADCYCLPCGWMCKKCKEGKHSGCRVCFTGLKSTKTDS